MKSLRKKDQIGVPVNAEQRRKIERAADIISRQRSEIVPMAVLVRELLMPKVEEIIAAADIPAAPAA